MNNLLASQDLIVRWFALVSSMIVGVLALLAGGAFLFTQQQVALYDSELPRLYLLIAGPGLMGVMVALLIYLAAILSLLGYGRSHARDMVAIVLFIACAGYLTLVALGSIVPYFSGMKSVM